MYPTVVATTGCGAVGVKECHWLDNADAFCSFKDSTYHTGKLGLSVLFIIHSNPGSTVSNR